MQKVEDFRKHAEECRALANRSRSSGERNMLLNMACTWDDLAKTRLSQLAQEKRMKDIAPGPGGEDRTSGALIPIDRLNTGNDE
jgi:hypothetical protein